MKLYLVLALLLAFVAVSLQQDAKPVDTNAEAGGDKTGTEGDTTGTEGDKTGTEGDKTGTEGDKTGTEGDKTGAEGDKTGTEGDKTGAEGDKTGTEGDKTGTEGDKTGTEGDKTGAEGDKTGTDGDKTGTDDKTPKQRTDFIENVDDNCKPMVDFCFRSDSANDKLAGKVLSNAEGDCSLLEEAKTCLTTDNAGKKCTDEDYDKMKDTICFSPKTVASVLMVAVLCLLSKIFGQQ